ncbi:MAG: hypothetical protein JW751_09010 [Polyangiaceae bacterium]|nr:hypothetical protein [Polyangiaceae bacterium]
MTRRHPGPGRPYARFPRVFISSGPALVLVALAACTDSPGATPRAAVRIAPSTGGCGVGPYVIPVNIPGPEMTTDTTVGTRVEDGKNDANVDCRVSRSGSGYSITGSVGQGTTAFFVNGNVESTGEQSYTGTGQANFVAPFADSIRSTDCTFTVSPVQQIGEGKVWASVSCINTIQGSNPGYSCEFHAAFVFENCES